MTMEVRQMVRAGITRFHDALSPAPIVLRLRGSRRTGALGNVVMRSLLAVVLTLLAAGQAHAALIGLPLKPPTIESIAGRYAHYDLDGDGVAEINSISPMSFEPATLNAGAAGVAIVFVDPRVIASPDAILSAALVDQLRRYRDDLVHEGYRPRFLVADVYRGAIHQDGRTLLAMRRFLQDVRASYPDLIGVTLVGSFPEATLFRRVLSRTVENGQQYLTVHPERINPRADIVLGDLDGNWEPLYQLVGDNEHLKMSVPNGLAFPYSGQFVTGTTTELFNVHWEDIFYIQDDSVTRMTATMVGGPVSVYVQSNAQRNPELTAADRGLSNPIAQPEIMVSRLDARGIAVNPAGVRDRFMRGLLAADGKPQALEFDFPVAGDFRWDHIATLEQRILLDYLDRNHQHRNNAWVAGAYHVSSITQLHSGLPSPYTNNLKLRAADLNGFGVSTEYEEANLANYALFLRDPSVLRSIESHSSARRSEFFDHDPPAGTTPTFYYGVVDALIGGRVWEWEKTNLNGRYQLTPSAKPLNGYATWSFGRTLWENQILKYSGQSFYVHGGCSVNVPDQDEPDLSYDDDRYGLRNNADSVLFFENGLALLTRGKVFNDFPAAFGPSVAAAGLRFGSAWRGSFIADGADATLRPGALGDDRVLSNKRAYFWGLRGDWSIKLRYN
jgi:hypothetical protein